MYIAKSEKSDKPIRRLDILLVGDFAQLPPVLATSIMSALVKSTQQYVLPEKDMLMAAHLAGKFVKFDLSSF